MQNGMTLIINERFRQICSEGWSATHDDALINGELAAAARCYFGWKNHLVGDPKNPVPSSWPFDPKWWKPKNDISDLVRAGALFMAERDRLIRAGELVLSTHMHRSAADIACMIDSLERSRRNETAN